MNIHYRGSRGGSETRARVLDAARRVLSERGIARLRVDAVAREAGLSVGALYRHFRGREDLILAVILDSLPPVRELALAPAVDVAALIELVLAVYEHETRMAAVAVTVLADEVLHSRFRQAVAAAPGDPHDFTRMLQQALERHRSAGQLRADLNPAQAAATIQARCFHAAVMHRLFTAEDRDSTPTELAETLVRELL